ncbi:MAG TPA: GNAT family N-acetyltransferase [Candidatus Sulfopaludibacter sp.]|nr:GNAT family N-acetyltransferase [Candidatus Sulfopaludibacter sp.]
MRIRPPVPADYGAMAELAGQLGYPCTVRELRARLAGLKDPRQYAVFVAEAPDGQVSGWIGVYIFRSVETAPCAEISGLIVDRGRRSRGIGQLLLDAALKWARRRGFAEIAVHSNVIRRRAHRFYERHGFHHVKTQKLLSKRLT